jgi:hypothetical protein
MQIQWNLAFPMRCASVLKFAMQQNRMTMRAHARASHKHLPAHRIKSTKVKDVMFDVYHPFIERDGMQRGWQRRSCHCPWPLSKMHAHCPIHCPHCTYSTQHLPPPIASKASKSKTFCSMYTTLLPSFIERAGDEGLVTAHANPLPALQMAVSVATRPCRSLQCNC